MAKSAINSNTDILTLHWPSLVMLAIVVKNYGVRRSVPTTFAILTIPVTTFNFTSELSSLSSSIRIG